MLNLRQTLGSRNPTLSRQITDLKFVPRKTVRVQLPPSADRTSHASHESWKLVMSVAAILSKICVFRVEETH